jgi:AMP nucleosidase
MDRKKLFHFAFGCAPLSFPGKVLITPVFPLKYFKQYYPEERSFKGRLYSGYFSGKGAEEIAVVHSGIGDRLLGDGVLLLAETRVKELLFLGTCGGLKDTKIGDIIVAESAFDGEGFSRYYREGFSALKLMDSPGGLEKSDRGSVARVYDALSKRTGRVRTGPVFTIGSLLAESPGNLAEIAGKGYCGIEMELSAVYRASEVAGIKSAGILAVSDLPKTKGLEEGQNADERTAFDNAITDMIRIGVEVFQ